MSGALRVLQIHNRYRQPGGEDVVVDAERALLQSNGYEVIRFERTNPGSAIPATAAMALAPWNPSTAASLARLIEATRPSVAHVHNTWFSVSPSVISAAHRASVPTLMTIHNYRLSCINAQLLRDGQPCELCVGTHPWNGVRYRCYRGSFASSSAAAITIALNRRVETWKRKVNLFLVLTHFMQQILKSTQISPERIVQVPNFAPDPGPRTSSPSQSETILFVGRLAPEKGIDVVIEAWKRSAPSGLQLVVVGDGPLREVLESSRVPGVVFRGSVPADEVRKLMLASRAMVFPSVWYEGQPIVLLEALAAGLPVFGSALESISETIGEGGVAVDSWRGFSFGELGDLDRLGVAARSRWAEGFTPERHLASLLAAYDQAAYWHNREA